MSFRKIVVSFTVAVALVPAAFANGASTWIGGEAGFQDHPVQSAKSRSEVRGEFLAWRANPVTSDGGLAVGGEAGYVPPQHSYAYQGGKLVHTDKIAHNTPKPSLEMTDAERRLFQELYAN
jgi:hypothetical protein